MSFKNIAVIGASGNLGNGILPLLLESGLNITAVTRQTSESTFPQTIGDAVLCLVSVADVRAEITMVDAAVATGVQWFIPSEFGHDTTNPRVVEVLPLFRQKVKIVDHLRLREKDGLSWTSFHTGFFFDFGLTFDLLGFDLRQKTSAIWDHGNNRSNLYGSNVARRSKNQDMRIATVTTTQNEILQALERVSGTRFQVTRIETVEGKRLGDQRLASGDNDLAGFFLLLKYTLVACKEGLLIGI
ncbi:NmrA-like family protein [Trichoderma sp. SZMC 28015]